MSEIPKLTQNFIDMLEEKIRAGTCNNGILVGKLITTLLRYSPKDVKLLNDDKYKDNLRDIIKQYHPNLLDTLDKLLVLK